MLISVIAIGCGATPAEKPDSTQAESTPVEETTPLLMKTASSPATAAAAPKTHSAPPPMTIDPSKSYTATIVLEKGGEMIFELYPKEAPTTVNSFVFLAKDGYYDGVTFHRVIPEFMAQGGDPTGTGAGGPGFEFDNELSALRRHDGPGVLSMANRGIRDGRGTNGSQFFITFVPTAFLDGYEPDGTAKDCTVPRTSCHTVFGKLIGGNPATVSEPPRDNIGLFTRTSRDSRAQNLQLPAAEETGIRSMAVLNSISARDPSRATLPGDAIKTIRIEERESQPAAEGESGRR